MANTITIEIPAEFTMKIGGEEMTINLTDAHDTWVQWFVARGVKRGINDTFSGAGDNKAAMAKALIDEIQSGAAKAVRATGGGGLDAIESQMVAMARPQLKDRVDGYDGMTATAKTQAIWAAINDLPEKTQTDLRNRAKTIVEAQSGLTITL